MEGVALSRKSGKSNIDRQWCATSSRHESTTSRSSTPFLSDNWNTSGMMGRRIVLLALLHAIFLFGKIDAANAFVACRSLLDRTVPPATSLNAKNVPNLVASSLVASSIMIGTASFNPPAAQSFAPSDYASETVQQVVRSLKDASGDVEATFKVYENIAGIITEGTGIGGMVNYSKSLIGIRSCSEGTA